MAYCEHCGAYIPDGQKICLACGYDPDAEAERAKQAQAAARAYQAAAAEREAQEEDSIRAEVERRRAERQANDRVWAENERRRRQMEEDFRRSQEEKERRAESYANRGTRSSVNIGGRRYTFGTEEQDGEERTEQPRRTSRSNNRGLAAISYLGILFFVPLLFGQDDDFVQFHAKQGLKLFSYTMLGTAIGSFVGVGWVVTLLGFILAVKGVTAAAYGKKEELPILKKLKWF